MKARGRRPSAFIVLRCLETPVKHDARVFDMASKTIHTSLVIRGYCFSALISHEIVYRWFSLSRNKIISQKLSSGKS